MSPSLAEQLARFIDIEVQQDLERAPDGALGLPGSTYWDPAFHALERELLFTTQWVAVALATGAVTSQFIAYGSLPWIALTIAVTFGLYGLLRPLDLMQPYRLEMGLKFANPGGRNLYEFWGSYSGVMGLPLYETVELLAACGIRCAI